MKSFSAFNSKVSFVTAAIVFAAIIIGALSLNTQRHTDVASRQSSGNETTFGPSAPIVQPVHGTNIDARISQAGLPQMPFLRKKVYLRTAKESTSELVQDIGNQFDVSEATCALEEPMSRADVEFYDLEVKHNMKVARLIADGANHLQEIVPELASAIQNELPAYPKTCADALKLDTSDTKYSPSVGEVEPFHDLHHRYEDPRMEVSRATVETYGAFYIMADLGQLKKSDLLRSWTMMLVPEMRVYRCRQMDAWLIDCYYRESGGPEADAYLAWIGGKYISGPTERVAAWDASWDMTDPMLAMAQVNTSGLKTIEVLSLPHGEELNDEKADTIIKYFNGHP